MTDWIVPDWPAPKNIKACVTTRRLFIAAREQGLSKPPYHFFNLAKHVGDDVDVVNQHRQQLREQLHLKNEPQWLNQVHGNRVVEAAINGHIPEADGCFTTQKNLPCAVLTADCLPVLFCNDAGDWVGAAHGGWRGLVNGILRETVNSFSGQSAQLMAWLGPAISVKHFEVGQDVRDAVLQLDSSFESIFCKSNVSDKWMADLYELARLQLRVLGIERVYGGDYCTFADATRFYSFRRDGMAGRQASLVWCDKS